MRTCRTNVHFVATGSCFIDSEFEKDLVGSNNIFSLGFKVSTHNISSSSDKIGPHSLKRTENNKQKKPPSGPPLPIILLKVCLSSTKYFVRLLNDHKR